MNTKTRTKRRTRRKASRRTTITVPADLLAETDRAARERGESRSRYIARVLRAAMRARRDEEITRRLDEFYARYPEIAEEERRCAEEMERASGIDWSDEGW
jgi:metal-responsive CopG/Arc/MetJ family transcriptional regulator